jgi:hypothetical protein
MSREGLSRSISSLAISKSLQEWSATQSWLAEVIRAVATILYAKATEEARESSPFAIHRNAISGQVVRTFGLILDETAPELSVSGGIDILVRLGDLATIGEGYCIPRESRIVRLTRNWGRIGGGLPLSFSEHQDAGVKAPPMATIGRIVELVEDSDVDDRGTEHSDVFTWIRSNDDQIISLLIQALPDRPSSQPPNGSVKFYHAELTRVRMRGDRWQNKAVENQFAVARTTRLPTHYMVCFRKENLSGWRWFEVSKEEARKWIMLAERRAGTKNKLPAKHSADEVHLWLPDMLPDAWTTALFSCSATICPTDGGWQLGFPGDVLPLLRMILQSANLELI